MASTTTGKDEEKKNGGKGDADAEAKITPGTTFAQYDPSTGKKPPAQSWQTLDSTKFQVRMIDYAKTKKKSSSTSAIYDTFAVDLVALKQKVTPIAHLIDVPDSCRVDKSLGLPGLLVINWMLPDYAPSNPAAVWSEKKEDGEGYSLVFYGALSDATKKELAEMRAAGTNLQKIADVQGVPDKSSSSGGGGLLRGWFGGGGSKKADEVENLGAADPNVNPSGVSLSLPLLLRFMDATRGKLDGVLSKRLKAITQINNIDECEFNTVTRQLAKKYNGTPFLIRDTATYEITEDYININIDVHRFSYLARTGLHGCKDTLRSMSFDMALVIQGETNDELPEQILCAARINCMDLNKALTLKGFSMDSGNSGAGAGAGSGSSK